MVIDRGISLLETSEAKDAELDPFCQNRYPFKLMISLAAHTCQCRRLFTAHLVNSSVTSFLHSPQTAGRLGSGLNI
jgi:hypothetical protein